MESSILLFVTYIPERFWTIFGRRRRILPTPIQDQWLVVQAKDYTNLLTKILIVWMKRPKNKVLLPNPPQGIIVGTNDTSGCTKAQQLKLNIKHTWEKIEKILVKLDLDSENSRFSSYRIITTPPAWPIMRRTCMPFLWNMSSLRIFKKRRNN